MFLLLEACEAKAFLDELDILALMIAALFHDIDHPGLNNGFLVKTSDPLAIRYNLRSVSRMGFRELRRPAVGGGPGVDLSASQWQSVGREFAENHHAAICWHLLLEPEINILSELDDQTIAELQKKIISCILATDMSKHVKIMARLEACLLDVRHALLHPRVQ
eukprot:9068210-Pyramimonas_sp.AAC.1